MIQAFDKTGAAIGYPNFIELQWNRRFNGFGDFVIYMPVSEYDPDVKYIQNVGRPETGIIQKIVYEQKPEGDFVTISGFFIEQLLNYGMLWQDKGYTATTAAGVRTRIRHFCRDCLTMVNPPSVTGYTNPPIRSGRYQLYRLSLGESNPTPNTMNFAYAKGTPCGDALLNWLNENGFSMYAFPIWSGDLNQYPAIGLGLVTYSGVDRSGSVIFGKEYGDVISAEYALDDSATTAEGLAVQEISAAQASSYSSVVQLATPSGTKYFVRLSTTKTQPQNMGVAWPFKIYYTSVNDTSLSQTNLYAQMRSEAQAALLDNTRLETISVDVIQNNKIYLEDYDLGDTCGVVISEIGKTFTAQIMEVHEVTSANKTDVQIVLGTPRRQKRR